MSTQTIDQLASSLGMQRLPAVTPAVSTSAVLIVNSHNDPAKIARIVAEIQRYGYTMIMVSEEQFHALEAAGLDSDLMCICQLNPGFGHQDYAGGLIVNAKFDMPRSKKLCPSLPNPSLRNRWGQIR